MKLFNSIASAAAVITLPMTFVEPATARTYEALCNFNNKVIQKCTVYSGMGYLSLTWADGINDTYKVGVTDVLTDSRGGKWHRSEFSKPHALRLQNTSNGNWIKITFE